MASDELLPDSRPTEPTALLSAYQKLIKDHASACALARDRDVMAFILILLNDERDDVVLRALLVLNDLRIQLGESGKLLRRAYKFKESVRLVMQRFVDREEYMMLCRKLLPIEESSRTVFKVVNVYFYEKLDQNTSDLLTATLTSVKGIISVTFNMLNTVCTLHVRAIVTKTQLVNALNECGVLSADLGLMKDGREERVAIGRSDIKQSETVDCIPDDQVPLSPNQKVNADAVCTQEQKQGNRDLLDKGFNAVAKGISYVFRRYF